MIALGLLAGLATLAALLALDARRQGRSAPASYAPLLPGALAATGTVLLVAVLPSGVFQDWPRVLGVLAPIAAATLLGVVLVRYPGRR